MGNNNKKKKKYNNIYSQHFPLNGFYTTGATVI